MGGARATLGGGCGWSLYWGEVWWSLRGQQAASARIASTLMPATSRSVAASHTAPDAPTPTHPRKGAENVLLVASYTAPNTVGLSSILSYPMFGALWDAFAKKQDMTG